MKNDWFEKAKLLHPKLYDSNILDKFIRRENGEFWKTKIYSFLFTILKFLKVKPNKGVI